MRYSHKKIYTGVIVVVLIIIACFVYGSKVKTNTNVDIPVVVPPRNDLASEVPMIAIYKTKIIYTADMSSPKQDYIDDCSTRGGTFNACGSPCAPDAEVCAMHCAYTCTLPTATN